MNQGMNEYANMNKVIPATPASYFHLLLGERNLGVNTSDHCVVTLTNFLRGVWKKDLKARTWKQGGQFF